MQKSVDHAAYTRGVQVRCLQVPMAAVQGTMVPCSLLRTSANGRLTLLRSFPSPILQGYSKRRASGVWASQHMRYKANLQLIFPPLTSIESKSSDSPPDIINRLIEDVMHSGELDSMPSLAAYKASCPLMYNVNS